MERIKKITQSARDELCTFNSPICNHDHTTTVYCHLNESFAGKGMGLKAYDFAGFYGCSDCHRYYDNNMCDKNEMYFYLLRAVIKTLKRLFEKGIIK